MRILYIEDDEWGEDYAGLLKQEGYSVDYCANIGLAMEHLEEKNSNYYDALLLDLDMNAADLPCEYREIIMNSKRKMFAGWVFYNNYIRDNYAYLLERTVFFTGYVAKLKDNISPEEFDKLKIVSKIESDSIKPIKAFLKDSTAN